MTIVSISARNQLFPISGSKIIHQITKVTENCILVPRKESTFLCTAAITTNSISARPLFGHNNFVWKQIEKNYRATQNFCKHTKLHASSQHRLRTGLLFFWGVNEKKELTLICTRESSCSPHLSYPALPERCSVAVSWPRGQACLSCHPTGRSAGQSAEGEEHLCILKMKHSTVSCWFFSIPYKPYSILPFQVIHCSFLLLTLALTPKHTWQTRLSDRLRETNNP